MKKILRKLDQIDFIIILVLALVGFGLIGSIFSKTPPRQSLSKVTQEKPASREILPVKFSPDSLQLSLSEPFSLNIVPAEELSALIYRLEIFFDPQVLSVKDTLAGNFFNEPTILRKEIDNRVGRVYFSAGIAPKEMRQSGEPKNRNTLSIFVFEAKPQYNQEEKLKTTISFGKKTMIFGKEKSFENSNLTLKPFIITLNDAARE